MELFRQWITAICCACFAAGIVRALTGGKSKTTVINLVAVLYIVLSAAGTVRADWTVDLQTTRAEIVEPSTDARSLAVDEAERAVVEQFEQRCADEGLEVRLDLQLEDDGTNCEVSQIVLTVTDPSDGPAALDLAESWFGEGAAITVNTEEGQ